VLCFQASFHELLFLFVMHACACHAFNATQVVGFRFAVLAPTPATIQNLQCYKDITVVSQRPVVTTQAALDAMQVLESQREHERACGYDREAHTPQAIAD
jgi:hypothetical protein